jgi:hypothetical protein
MVCSTQHNHNESLLLQHPPELRNHIYSYVFGGQRIDIGCQRWKLDSRYLDRGPGTLIGPWLYPGVSQPSQEGRYAVEVLPFLLVCRQVYSEARLLPFSLNTFGYSDYEVLRSWSARMRTQMASITACCIWTDKGIIDPSDTLRSIPHFPNLKQVEVIVNCDKNGFDDFILALTAPPLVTPGRAGPDPSRFRLSGQELQELERNEPILRKTIEQLLGKIVQVTFLRKFGTKVLY